MSMPCANKPPWLCKPTSAPAQRNPPSHDRSAKSFAVLVCCRGSAVCAVGRCGAGSGGDFSSVHHCSRNVGGSRCHERTLKSRGRQRGTAGGGPHVEGPRGEAGGAHSQ